MFHHPVYINSSAADTTHKRLQDINSETTMLINMDYGLDHGDDILSVQFVNRT